MNRIRHNSPSSIQCLWVFPILFFTYLLFRCYCYNHYKTQKYYFCYCYHYYHTTLLLNTLLHILSYPGVVELTTQLLILENILWLPLCRINKFGLNTLPSKTVPIPYTCDLSWHQTRLMLKGKCWIIMQELCIAGDIRVSWLNNVLKT